MKCSRVWALFIIIVLLGVLVDSAKVNHSKERASDKKDKGSQEVKEANKKSASTSAEDKSDESQEADSQEQDDDKEGWLSTKPLTNPPYLKKLLMKLFNQISTMVQGGAFYKNVDIDKKHQKMKFKEQYNGYYDNDSDKTLGFYNIEININDKPVTLKENCTETKESKKPSDIHPKPTEPPQPVPTPEVNTTTKAP